MRLSDVAEFAVAFAKMVKICLASYSTGRLTDQSGDIALSRLSIEGDSLDPDSAITALNAWFNSLPSADRDMVERNIEAATAHPTERSMRAT
jgi:hypothetical protein